MKILYWRAYKFHGQQEWNGIGIKWCLRNPRTGDCVEHGIEFATLENVLKRLDLPKAMAKFNPTPIGEKGSCKFGGQFRNAYYCGEPMRIIRGIS